MTIDSPRGESVGTSVSGVAQGACTLSPGQLFVNRASTPGLFLLLNGICPYDASVPNRASLTWAGTVTLRSFRVSYFAVTVSSPATYRFEVGAAPPVDAAGAGAGLYAFATPLIVPAGQPLAVRPMGTRTLDPATLPWFLLVNLGAECDSLTCP